MEIRVDTWNVSHLMGEEPGRYHPILRFFNYRMIN